MTRKPLDFSVFPTILLVTTLLRLSLNVASTRIVLLEGPHRPDARGQGDRGFRPLLVGGNTAVGLVVFIILTVINFVVITKGAGGSPKWAPLHPRRHARQTDGHRRRPQRRPDRREGGQRRAETLQEADFYGAMDGASKFVRGDAVAGILILGINVIGGLIVGVLQHNMELGQAATNYTLLTIGDGLVAQLPTLIISVAAGLVVSRSATKATWAPRSSARCSPNPQVLVLTAAILGILGLIPGMPNFVFLLLASGLGYMAWRGQGGGARRSRRRPPAAPVIPPRSQDAPAGPDVTPVDVLGLEVGYRLIPMVDKGQDGELLKRIRGLRKEFARDIGFLAARCISATTSNSKPNDYRIVMKGVEIGASSAFRGSSWPSTRAAWRARSGSRDHRPGLRPAGRVDRRQPARTGPRLGYTVVDASTVVATHQPPDPQPRPRAPRPHRDPGPARTHRQGQPQAGRRPGAQAAAPGHRAAGAAEPARRGRQHPRHAFQHRRGAGRTHRRGSRTRWSSPRGCARPSAGHRPGLFPGNGEVQVMALDPGLERVLMQAMGGGGGDGAIEPGLADTLLRETAAAAQRMEDIGLPAVLLVPAPLRWLLSRFLRRSVPSPQGDRQLRSAGTRLIRVSAVIARPPEGALASQMHAPRSVGIAA